jgi:hypothetical protein
MRSNFESPLKLTGDTVEACGELEWDAGETEALVTVTITQKNAKAAGVASSPPSFRAPTDEWMLQVRSQGSKKFKPGPAHAVGVVATSGDTADDFHWEQDVEVERA